MLNNPGSLRGDIIDVSGTTPHTVQEESQSAAITGQYSVYQDKLAAMDCGFLQRIGDSGGGTTLGQPVCEPLDAKALAWMLLMAPVLVPVGAVDGILSGRPVKRWWNPQHNDRTTILLRDMGFGGIPIVIGAGLLSIYLWYRIYKHVKGGN